MSRGERLTAALVLAALGVISSGSAACSTERRAPAAAIATSSRASSSSTGSATSAAPSGVGALSAAPAVARPKTLFEDTTWGMSAAELHARYDAERLHPYPGIPERLELDREVGGLPMQIAFLVGPGGLRFIEISVLRRYDYDEFTDACDSDRAKLESILEAGAGPATQIDAASSKWLTESSEILLYCDESLGASFEPRKP